MKTLWRWFFRGVVVAGILFVCFASLVAFSMSRANVTQSDGFTDDPTRAAGATLSGALPTSASDFRFCQASVGMGGRLLVYRFSAPLTDLRQHARAEYAAHWDTPAIRETLAAPSPITTHAVKQYQSAFGVDIDWMLPPPDATGTVIDSADGQTAHRPTIFIDEANGVLYFRMTD